MAGYAPAGGRPPSLDHTTLTGKIVVGVDGTAIAESRLLFNEWEIEFAPQSSKAVILIDYAMAGYAAHSELHIGGKYVEPLN